MSKPKNTAAKRPSPPDRDGDGRPGGSLPGNETVDAAKGPEVAELPTGLTDAAEGAEATGPTIRDTGILASEIAELVRTENTAQEIMDAYPDLVEADIETAVQWSVAEGQKANAGDPDRPDDGPPNSEATPPVEEQIAWGRDDDRIHARLLDAGVCGKNGGSLALETVASWSDDDARAAEAFADQMTAPGSHTDNVGDERTADFKPIDLPAILADHEILPRREVTPVEDEAEEPVWTRDNDAVLEDLQLIDEGWRVEITLSDVAIWTDEQAKVAQAWADDMLNRTGDDAEGPTPPEFLKPHLYAYPSPDAPADEAPADETFSAEEIAAGQTDLVQEEGETAIAAAMAAPVIDDADPLVMIETRTAPVALRLGNLRRLVENRLFYKSEAGFSPNYHAPHVDEAEVRVWLDNGLARWDETAGRIGGVYVEPEARRVLRDQPQRAAA